MDFCSCDLRLAGSHTWNGRAQGGCMLGSIGLGHLKPTQSRASLHCPAAHSALVPQQQQQQQQHQLTHPSLLFIAYFCRSSSSLVVRLAAARNSWRASRKVVPARMNTCMPKGQALDSPIALQQQQGQQRCNAAGTLHCCCRTALHSVKHAHRKEADEQRSGPEAGERASVAQHGQRARQRMAAQHLHGQHAAG